MSVPGSESRPSQGAGETPLPETLPVLPLRGLTVFPLAVLPVIVGQERSVRLVDDVMRGERLLALVTQRPDTDEPAGPDDLYQIGVAGIVHQLARAPDGTLRLVVQGLQRIRLGQFTATEPYLVAQVEPAPGSSDADVEDQALRRAVVDLFTRLAALIQELPRELVPVAESLTDPRQLGYLVASVSPFAVEVRQELLEIEQTDTLLRRLVELLQHELVVRELGRKIASETQERMTKAQRDYVLREQLRSIQQELGDGSTEGGTDDLRQQIEKANLPEEARREAERELNRLASVPAASPEHGIIRTYLEWMAALPWSTLSGGDIDVPFARRVLDEDHYDLEKIKDRILEYLAVKKLRTERQALVRRAAGEGDPAAETADAAVEGPAREPILCLVGPPGVGKTSLGQSIARALGRKFLRISLGGLRDEAEIRGHRRTYIGAMPGRIIQGIRRAAARDPVFMLDEIDKVGADWRGDPSSALLEVLDPAQNNTFLDTYLGVAFDLSQVLFIATANTLDTIPGPLRDRMEILQLAGYTDAEKVRIGQHYLVPKQRAAHGLTDAEIAFDDEALRQIVRAYTREAGVRNLDREIATVCRKVAREIAEGQTEPRHITAESVETYLGRPRFHDETAERTERPGVATGLAWTPVGGDVLFIEASMMPSREEQLVLTGMLGDVMRESAQAALTFVRSNAEQLGIDPTVFEGKTIHVHVPAGAIPKDGPSAGVTMATALASLASGRPVRSGLAMTGEITLRGKVLPVGGIKEKVLAAHRIGIRSVILPRHNERDLEDIPAELRQELTITFANTADQVIAQALEPARKRGARKRADGGNPAISKSAPGRAAARGRADGL